jgi:hypothetical protein
VARPSAPEPVFTDARARPGDGRAVARRPEAPAGPGAAADAKAASATRADYVAAARAASPSRLRPRPERGRHRAVGRGRSAARASTLDHGDVVIAAITSCTNTSTPSVMIGAGLLAKKAVEKGLPQALGQDLAGPGLEGGHRLLRARPACSRPRQARLQPGRLRLHHLHRQLRPAAAGDLRGVNEPATWSRSPCCRATATSRAGSTRT